jgi:hypothetical protein
VSTRGTYIHRPVEVEAVQWTGHNFNELVEFGAPVQVELKNAIQILDLWVGSEYVPVSVGDWIVRSIGYESHRCVEMDHFHAWYERKTPA